MLCATTRDDDGHTRFPAVALYRFSFNKSAEEDRCVALQLDIGMSVSADPVYSYVFRETGDALRTNRSGKEPVASTFPTWLEGARAALNDLEAFILALSQALNYLLNNLEIGEIRLKPSGHVRYVHLL